MTTEEKIKKHLQELGKVQAATFPAVVTEVNEAERTITVKDSYNIEYPDVRLKASIKSSDDIIFFPKKDANVIVAIIGGDEATLLVIAIDEVDKIEGKIGDIILKVDKNGVELNGNQFGSLIKIEEIVKKLNTIENAFNDHVNEFNNHTHNAPQAPSGTLATLGPLVLSNQNLQKTQVTEIENDKIKHG